MLWLLLSVWLFPFGADGQCTVFNLTDAGNYTYASNYSTVSFYQDKNGTLEECVDGNHTNLWLSRLSAVEITLADNENIEHNFINAADVESFLKVNLNGDSAVDIAMEQTESCSIHANDNKQLLVTSIEEASIDIYSTFAAVQYKSYNASATKVEQRVDVSNKQHYLRAANVRDLTLDVDWDIHLLVTSIGEASVRIVSLAEVIYTSENTATVEQRVDDSNKWYFRAADLRHMSVKTFDSNGVFDSVYVEVSNVSEATSVIDWYGKSPVEAMFVDSATTFLQLGALGSADFLYPHLSLKVTALGNTSMEIRDQSAWKIFINARCAKHLLAGLFHYLSDIIRGRIANDEYRYYKPSHTCDDLNLSVYYPFVHLLAAITTLCLCVVLSVLLFSDDFSKGKSPIFRMFFTHLCLFAMYCVLWMTWAIYTMAVNPIEFSN